MPKPYILYAFSGPAWALRARLRFALEAPPPAGHAAAAERICANLEARGPVLAFWSLTPWGAVTVRRVTTERLARYIRGEHRDE